MPRTVIHTISASIKDRIHAAALKCFSPFSSAAPDACGPTLTPKFKPPVAGRLRAATHRPAFLTRNFPRTSPADPHLHYAGVPLLVPYKDYPLGQFPDTLVIRRSVLHRLLINHPTGKKYYSHDRYRHRVPCIAGDGFASVSFSSQA
jgi:hypothetical protein